MFFVGRQKNSHLCFAIIKKYLVKIPSVITWRAFNRVNKFLPLREENGKHKANCIVLNVVD